MSKLKEPTLKERIAVYEDVLHKLAFYLEPAIGLKDLDWEVLKDVIKWSNAHSHVGQTQPQREEEILAAFHILKNHHGI